ncbi:autotransporter domain-containing protein [Microvirga sp. ACRRW]|uniref:autotransporter family protein n=1 Tax=Microvirga sp. ACRRW TaxID=2918205 RepID=UPI001EF6D788|nr:autotransporter outer membrane beta-barrel domain-containing protein [Microvirga sp. ACRRW]MCG7392284.1 autotransporter domain-containing protein [Microvirga sp. ACRRW]
MTTENTIGGTRKGPAGLWGNGDRISLTNNGTIRMLGSVSGEGMLLSGNDGSITNNGTVTMDGDSGDALFAMGNRNTLLNNGTIHGGTWSAGIAVQGDNNTLTNKGDISTSGDKAWGFRAYGDGNTLINDGTVTANGSIIEGMQVRGDNNTLLNTGTIQVTGRQARGVSIFGPVPGDTANTNTLVNRGVIKASGKDAAGVSLGNGGRMTVINEVGGLIESAEGRAIQFTNTDPANSNDRIENHGRISNLRGGDAVDLGNGDDTFLISSTSVIDGAIEAGTGYDTFTLSGSTDGRFDLSRSELRNFEMHEKTGSSTWTISGTSNRIMPWHVREGGLMVSGVMGGSSMTVYDGALLGGDGTVGGIDARPGSILSPGMNGIGSLAVTGNVLIADGTVYRIDLNASQESDRIVAGGAATVQGGTVQVNALSAAYTPGSRWTILTAEGGVTGQFSEVTTNLVFFRPVLSKDGKNIYLSLPRIDEPRPANPVTPGGDPVSPGDDPASPSIPDPAPMPTAFDVGTILVHDDLFRAAVLCRLRCSTGGLPSFIASDITAADDASSMTGATQQVPRDWALWAKAIGSWGSTQATQASLAVQRSTAGLVFGADTGFGTPYRLGIAGGYFSTSLDYGLSSASGHVESMHIGLYGSAAFGALNLRGGLAYAHHEVDTSFTTPYASNRFSSSLDSFQAFGELGYMIPINDRVMVEPFLGLAHVHVAGGGIAVEGFDTVTGRVDSFDTTYSTLGARLIATMPTEAGLITFKGLLGWRHAFGDTLPKASFSLPGDERPLFMTGIPIDKDSLVVEAGVNWEVSKNTTLSISYTGAMGRRDQEHTVRGGLTIRF